MSKQVFCPNCNSPAQSNSYFCNYCGTRLKNQYSPGAFFLSLAKSAAFFGVFFGIRLLVDALYTGFVTARTVAASPNGAAGITEEMIYEEYSYLAPEIAMLSAFLVLLCYAIYYRTKKKRLTKEISLKRMPFSSFGAMLAMGASAQIIVALFISILYTLQPDLADDSYSKLYELMFKHSNPYTEFAYIAVITPVIEETLFRGLIYTRLKKGMPKVPAIILSSIFFGLAHGNAEQFVYTFLLGLLMVLVYEKYNSLWAPVAIHAAFNGSNFLLQSLEFSDNSYYLIMLFAATGVFFIVSAFVFFTKMTAVSELSKAKEHTDYEAL